MISADAQAIHIAGMVASFSQSPFEQSGEKFAQRHSTGSRAVYRTAIPVLNPGGKGLDFLHGVPSVGFLPATEKWRRPYNSKKLNMFPARSACMVLLFVVLSNIVKAAAGIHPACFCLKSISLAGLLSTIFVFAKEML